MDSFRRAIRSLHVSLVLQHLTQLGPLSVPYKVIRIDCASIQFLYHGVYAEATYKGRNL